MPSLPHSFAHSFAQSFADSLSRSLRPNPRAFLHRGASQSGRRTASARAPISPRARAGSRAQAGQGMTEYIIIVALIAVAAIGIYTLFGQTIRNQTAGLALEMSGQDAATAIGNAQTNANTAQTNANVRKGLDNFNASNRP
jgi:Flp pilus assembly pilin Flp